MDKNELLLRKAIIDDDLLSMSNNELFKKDLTDFLYENDDICLVMNDDNTDMEHKSPMINILCNGILHQSTVKDLLVKLYGELRKVDNKDSLLFLNDIILSIACNENNKIDPLLKTLILLECDKKDLSNGSLLHHFCQYGEVHDELISKFKDRINFNVLSTNENIDLDLIDKYSNEDIDWMTLSINRAKDMSSSFIIKYYDKLDIECVIAKYLNDKEFMIFLIDIFIDSKYSSKIKYVFKRAYNNIKMNKDILDYYLEEKYLIYQLECGKLSWNTIHEIGLSRAFIKKYKDKLNIPEILKYYKLSDAYRKYLENYIK